MKPIRHTTKHRRGQSETRVMDRRHHPAEVAHTHTHEKNRAVPRFRSEVPASQRESAALVALPALNPGWPWLG